ncbi:unnamed protein product [Owenia fusiformis]|uniref:von Willebrand factor A domain-containing protein 7-like n=1 Tax=Owenia fusiformis TaxID=6347 RepID=A0A8J1UJL9_OWEFU|nr:unnamed protein product [Owenia fusiformis]
MKSISLNGFVCQVNSNMNMGKSIFVVFLLLNIGVINGFIPNRLRELFSNTASQTHIEITEKGILKSALRFFQENPHPDSDPIEVNGELTAKKLIQAYFGDDVSSKEFKNAIEEMSDANGEVDTDEVTSNLPSAHFDAERFDLANDRLIRLRQAVIAALDAEKFQSARKLTGQLMHTLQDFYSHSNWIEMGNTEPNRNLAVARSVGEVVSPDEDTCLECEDMTCYDNIIESINRRGLLTSGFFALSSLIGGPQKDGNGVEVPKKEGKCSHGGQIDITSKDTPAKGGINKDSALFLWSPHHYLHHQAADVAALATEEFLDGIREARGDEVYSQYLNLGFGTSLCFVIDTTGSMAADIEAAKSRSKQIVEERAKSSYKPYNYVLVPFNDPEYGPAQVTRDPDEFLVYLDELEAAGGNDWREYAISGVSLALQHVQKGSSCFVMTDAPAHDTNLTDHVIAQAKEKDVKLNFLVSYTGNNAERVPTVIADYLPISAATGGQIIDANKTDVLEITRVIDISLQSSEVLIYQVEGVSGTKTFPVDMSVSEVYVQVSSFDPLGTVDVKSTEDKTTEPSKITDLPNFVIYKLTSPETGLWEVTTSSSAKYNLKVTAKSYVDMNVKFVDQKPNSPHQGWRKIDGKPTTGGNTTILVLLDQTNDDWITLVEGIQFITQEGVVLKDVPVKNTTDILYSANEMLPSKDFRVLMYGKDNSLERVQRMLPELLSVSTIVVRWNTARNSSLTLEPGETAIIEYEVKNLGPSAVFKVEAVDSERFTKMVEPYRMTLGEESSETGTIAVTVPENTPLGTVNTITVTTSAETGVIMTNYFIFDIIVAVQNIDLEPPECYLILDDKSCPKNATECHYNDATWNISATFKDDKSGIGKIIIDEPVDKIYTIQDEPYMKILSYEISCCRKDVSVVVLDKAGNKGTCAELRRAFDFSGTPIIGIIICVLVVILLAVIVAFITYTKCKKGKGSSRQKAAYHKGEWRA